MSNTFNTFRHLRPLPRLNPNPQPLNPSIPNPSLRNPKPAHQTPPPAWRVRFWGLGCGVWRVGGGACVWGVLWVDDLVDWGAQGLRFRVWGLGFGVEGLVLDPAGEIASAVATEVDQRHHVCTGTRSATDILSENTRDLPGGIKYLGVGFRVRCTKAGTFTFRRNKNIPASENPWRWGARISMTFSSEIVPDLFLIRVWGLGFRV